MNNVILYSTKHGTTEKCAKLLGEKLSGKTTLIDLKGSKEVDLSAYDKVIIGGAVYMGKIQKEVTSFCKENSKSLLNKKLGVFICGMSDDIEKELTASYPKEILEKAEARECFGGEFIFQNMSFFEKLIIKKIAKTDKNISKLSEESINRFVEKMGV
ncbi:flavodoxin domain-containing protein [Clostridium sp. 19966]|uniref:flavodoxin domain-containing protein n=1 Tax=Clostridium sp. 19966 TaxID=2768166 RepID=UPI0028DFC4AE|nr:flavodoxin domain-containing protein [Clostridium sp. 19966]MDT8718350.1 flavodoxin domain-containing protein [Clostridium sp. 19966]